MSPTPRTRGTNRSGRCAGRRGNQSDVRVKQREREREREGRAKGERKRERESKGTLLTDNARQLDKVRKFANQPIRAESNLRARKSF